MLYRRSARVRSRRQTLRALAGKPRDPGQAPGRLGSPLTILQQQHNTKLCKRIPRKSLNQFQPCADVETCYRGRGLDSARDLLLYKTVATAACQWHASAAARSRCGQNASNNSLRQMNEPPYLQNVCLFQDVLALLDTDRIDSVAQADTQVMTSKCWCCTT
jgi:hypothetical protein